MSRTIVITRSVHNAAQELSQKMPSADEGALFSLADDKIDECHAAGDKAGVELWNDVWLFLAAKLVPDAVIRIVEDTP